MVDDDDPKVIRDLFGEVSSPKSFEVHEHSFVSGPRANRSERLVHSHEQGEIPHQHPHTGPAVYTIDKDEWACATGGVVGGSRKRFTAEPEGEQLARVELEDWQKSFEIHHAEAPPDWKGTGGGHLTAARMMLAFRMTATIIPFPRPKKAAG